MRSIEKSQLKPDKARKYDGLSVRKAIEEAKQRDNNQPNSPHAQAKGLKTALECKRLQIQIAEMEGTIMQRSDHLSVLRHHASLVLGVLEAEVQQVGIRTHDPQQMTDAEQRRDRIRKKLSEECAKVELKMAEAKQREQA
jgi:hypothetical protein